MFSGTSTKQAINILALHGKGASGTNFRQTLASLIDASNNNDHDMTCEWTFLDAPFDGQWWTLPPNTRSFNAKEYCGFDESARVVMDELCDGTKQYDVVLGHSQGAILLSALMATKTDVISAAGVNGYVLNGAAWPNPYTAELEKFVYNGNEISNSRTTKVLFVIGARDKINPPDGARRVQKSLEVGGLAVDTINHEGGHSFPVDDEKSVGAMIQWILSTVRAKQMDGSVITSSKI